VQALIRSGANGYVLKTAEPAEIIRGVLDVFEGRQVIDATLKDTMLEQTGKSFGQSSADISERELDVLRQAATGLTNKAIAVELEISSRTVQNHLANIFVKLGVENRTEAVLKAIQMGLMKMDPEQNKPSIRV
jgi:DNA-binding NarL/FixJ family response regulator